MNVNLSTNTTAWEEYTMFKNQKAFQNIKITGNLTVDYVKTFNLMSRT
jgi:hypothetical protein